MSAEEKIVIGSEDDGQRIDRYLKKLMPYSLVQKLIRKGAIRVNGKRTKVGFKLSTGDEVRIPPYEHKKPKQSLYTLTKEDQEFIKSIIIYDDGDIIAINKPSGIPTQGGGKEKRHIDGMLEALKNSEHVKPKLIHRLDKDTSGVMLLARNNDTIRHLGRQFKNRKVEKYYVALTSPAPELNEGTVSAPIGKVKGEHKDKMVIDEESTKNAITDFKVIQKASKEVALVAFKPLTGRTHQIRVHASDVLAAPIIGDKKYKGLITDGQELELENRLHLHACLIRLKPYEDSNKILELTAPLSEGLKNSWKAFGFDDTLDDSFFYN